MNRIKLCISSNHKLATRNIDYFRYIILKQPYFVTIAVVDNEIRECKISWFRSRLHYKRSSIHTNVHARGVGQVKSTINVQASFDYNGSPSVS